MREVDESEEMIQYSGQASKLRIRIVADRDEVGDLKSTAISKCP